MTDRQKIELIKKATEMLTSELTQEQYDFLYGREWKDIPAEEKEIWFTAWAETPNTIEHAARNTGCSPAEVTTAAKVVRAIRETWAAAAKSALNEFENNISAAELLEVLERAAKHLQQEAAEHQNQ